MRHLVLVLVLGMAGTAPAAVAQQAEPAAGEAANRIRAEQFFVRGMTRAFLEDHEGALRLFQEASTLAPRVPAILSAMAASHAALGDLQTALYYAQQARDTDPSVRAYHQQLAALYIERSDTTQAMATLKALLAAFPRDEEALFDLAYLASSRGQIQEALAAYHRLLEVAGEVPQVYERMYRLHAREDDQQAMEAVLVRLTEIAPGAGPYHRMLGDFLVRAGRLEAAVAAYRSALQRDPDDFSTTLTLADLYREMGQPATADTLVADALDLEDATPEQLLRRAAPLYARASQDEQAAQSAIVLLTQVLAQDPAQADAALMLGDLQYERGAYDEAAALLDQVLQANPRDPSLWVQTASAYLQAGAPERSIGVAEEGLLLFPGFLDLVRVQGYALMEVYRNREAAAAFTEALSLLEERPDAPATARADLWAALGLLAARRQDHAASDSLYALALTADPNHAVVLNNLAYSLADRSLRLEEAESLAARAVALEPANPSFLDTLGWVYFRRGNLEEALEWLNRALDAGGPRALTLEHVGDTLHALGRSDEAQASWRQALELNPNQERLRQKVEQQHP